MTYIIPIGILLYLSPAIVGFIQGAIDGYKESNLKEDLTVIMLGKIRDLLKGKNKK